MAERYIVWIVGAGWGRRGRGSEFWGKPAVAHAEGAASKFTLEEAEQVAELWRSARPDSDIRIERVGGVADG